MAQHIIGSAWVRIRALTDSLDNEVRDAFKDSAIDKMGEELGKKIGDGISKGVAEGMEDAKREMEDSLDELGKDRHRAIEIDLDVNREHFNNKVREALASLDDLEQRKIVLEPDFDNSELNRMRQRLHDMLNDQDWDINLELNRTDLQHIKDQLEDLRDEAENDEIEMNTSLNYPMLKYVQGRLLALTRNRVVKIITELDPVAYKRVLTLLAALSGGRALQNMLERLRDWAKELDKNIPKLAMIITAFGTLAAMILTATSNVLAFAASLAEVTFAGLLLPGILAGFVFGFVSLAQAMQGAGQQLSDISNRWNALGKEMSVNFWERARDPILELSNTLFPELERGAQRVSIALGNLFAEMSNNFRRELGAGVLENMWDNLALSIQITSFHANDFARIIENLGTLGSSYLPRLAAWFGDISHTFANWLDRNRESGQLTEWMELGIRRTRELGRVVRFATSIIYHMGVAAEKAGGSSLTTMADTLERVATIVKGEPFQTEMTKTFTAAHNAMTMAANEGGEAFKEMMKSLVPVAQAALPMVGQTIGSMLEGISNGLRSSGFQEGFLDMIRGLRDGIRSLESMWVPLAEGLGAVGTILGGLATNFGPLINQMFQRLSGTLIALTPSIVGISEVLSSLLMPVLQAVGTLIETFAKGLGALPIGVTLPLLAGLAGALKLVQVEMATDAVTKFALGMGSLNSLLPRIAAGIKSVAAALKLMLVSNALLLGIAVALTAIGVAIHTISNGGVVEKVAEDFEHLIRGLDGSKGSMDALNAAVGNGADVFVDVDGHVKKVVQTVDEFGDIVGKNIIVSDHSADSIQRLGDAMRVTADRAGRGFWESVLGMGEGLHLFGIHSAAMNQSIQDLEAFDLAAANVVRSGNLDEIARLEAMVAEEIRHSGRSRQEVLEQMPEYNQAIEVHRVQQERLAQEINDATRELIEMKKVYEDVGNITPEMIEQINNSATGYYNFGKAVEAASVEVEGSNEKIVTSVQAVIEELEKSYEAQVNYSENMQKIAGKISKEFFDELIAKGPEYAGFVQMIADAPEEELARLDAAFLKTYEGPANFADNTLGLVNQEIKERLLELNLTTETGLNELNQIFQGKGEEMALAFASGASLLPTATDGVFKLNLNDLPNTQALIAQFEALGYEVVGGYVMGIEGNLDDVGASAEAIATRTREEMMLGLDIHSPSRVMETYGKFAVQGFTLGMDNSRGSVTTSGNGIVTTLKNVFTNAANFLLGDGERTGKGYVDGFNKTDTKTPGTTKRNNLRDALAAGNFNAEGLSKGNSFVNTFSKVDTGKPGREAVGKLRDGLNNANIRNSIRGSGTAAGNAFTSSANSVNAYSSGQSIAERFAQGLDSLKDRVKNAASSVAGAASAYFPKSPAEEGPFSGSGWGGWGEAIGEELAQGLLSQRNNVAAASHSLMSAVDLTSPATDISAGAFATYSSARQTATISAYREANEGFNSSHDQYTIDVTIDVDDIEGLKTVQEFTENAKLWGMM